MIDKALILNNIKNYLKIKKDVDFANYLGIKPQTLSTWYSRNVYDIHILYEKCVNIDPDYLLTGEGSIVRNSKDLFANSDENNLLKKNFNLMNDKIELLDENRLLLNNKIAVLEKELQECLKEKKNNPKVIG